MSGVKEVNQFATATQIRKIAQDSLAPLITRIEQEVQKMTKQTQEIKKQHQRMINIQKTQNSIENNIKQFQKTLSQIKLNMSDLKSQDNRNALTCTNNIENLKQQIQMVKRQLKKRQDKIKDVYDKAQSTNKHFNQHQQSTHKIIEQIRKKISQIYKQTLNVAKDIQMDSQRTKQEIKQVQLKVQKQLNVFNQNSKIIQLYLSQRDQINKKLNEFKNQFNNYVSYDILQKIKQQIELKKDNTLEIKKLLENIPTRKQLEDITTVINYLQEKVKDFAKVLQLQVQVQSIKRSIQQQQTKIEGNHVKIQTILQQISNRIDNMKKKRLDDKTQIIKSANQRFDQINQKIIILQQQINKKLQQSDKINTNKFLTLVKQFPQRQLILKDSLVKQISIISNQINNRCQSIQTLGSNLQQQLSLFNNRIIKMRSDNDMFQENIKKQIKQTQKYLKKNQQRLEIFGSKLSGLIQIIMINQATLIYQTNDEKDQKLVYVTYSDGIICQIDKINNSQGSINYRRQQNINLLQLRKATMLALINYVDNTIKNQQWMNWFQNKPSKFFNQQILQHYLFQMQKNQQKKQIVNNVISQSKSSKKVLPNLQVINQQKNQIKNQSTMPRQKSSMAKTRNKSITTDLNIVKQKLTTITHQQIQNKKSYHIKMKKNNDQNRYQETFLTSRSGRYSRLNNLMI